MSDLKKRKAEVRKQLLTLEKQIFDLETKYLEETKDFGNIFTGWENYLSSEKMKPSKKILYEDRHFSLSSYTSPVSRKEESKKVCSLLDNDFIFLMFLKIQVKGNERSFGTETPVVSGKPGRKKKKLIELDDVSSAE
jgi:hypothetical protein